MVGEKLRIIRRGKALPTSIGTSPNASREVPVFDNALGEKSIPRNQKPAVDTPVEYRPMKTIELEPVNNVPPVVPQLPHLKEGVTLEEAEKDEHEDEDFDPFDAPFKRQDLRKLKSEVNMTKRREIEEGKLELLRKLNAYFDSLSVKPVQPLPTNPDSVDPTNQQESVDQPADKAETWTQPDPAVTRPTDQDKSNPTKDKRKEEYVDGVGNGFYDAIFGWLPTGPPTRKQRDEL